MYEKMLVPLDGSKLSECVLPHVEELAKGCHVAEIVLLRVCEPPTVPADYPASLPENWDDHVSSMNKFTRQQCSLYLDEMESKLKARGFNVKTSSRLGDPAEEIVDYASKNGIDLIVMASHGRTGVARWALGSVAERVFRATCVPLLMVRAPGCVAGL